MAYFQWKPYVSVAQRRMQAIREMNALRKKGVDIQPVKIAGRKIASTFWGQAWCDQMESLHDFANRLPRGRTYVRNGSVCHLAVTQGRIEAKVSGSEIYDIVIKVDRLAKAKWNQIKQRSAGQIDSLLELLQGRISNRVMEVVTSESDGLFPVAGEIHVSCDCPDYAYLCKHAAAVLYGVGARLDERPELLFLLRGVNHEDLISAPAEKSVERTTRRGGRGRKVRGDLADVFGIELDEDDERDLEPAVELDPPARKKKRKKASSVKTEEKRTPDAESATPRSKSVRKKSGGKKPAPAKKKTTKKTTKKTAKTKKVAARAAKKRTGGERPTKKTRAPAKPRKAK
ncbi:MAG: SWIM zinc finger family protein [Pirellulaceae bacterium]